LEHGINRGLTVKYALICKLSGQHTYIINTRSRRIATDRKPTYNIHTR
jgi:hypothetical protein